MAPGGFKLSLAGAKGKPGFKALAEQPQKRRRLALDDDEPETTDAKQAITGWDAAEGGAVDANKKEEPQGPRIIPALANRDWRKAAQERQQARTRAPPPETNNSKNAAQWVQPQMAFGLTTFEKKDALDGEEQLEPMDVDGDAKLEDSRTEEEKLQAEAFEALVLGKSTDRTVIPVSEEEAYENDMREAPDAPDLAAYEATPIEGFGAALLRGMGWKDGESLSKDKKPLEKPKEIKKRPALLGIGAKPEAAVGVELGEWGGPKKDRRKEIKYNPVTLRNKHTGEMITEEELKERLAKQKEADAKAAKNNTFVGDDDEEDERRREKRRERKERERRHDDYGSERRSDKSRRNNKNKDRDDEYSDRDRDRRREKKYSEYEDSDRDRRRDKKYREDDYDDRRREKRREKDSGRDRSRSPYNSDRREKGRERDRRERSVDSKDRRDKRRERERSRSRDSEDRRRKRREYAYDDERGDRRSKDKDDKYSRR
ncbi:DNA primase large subunit Spp2 [Paraconiothyrium brasiliense]|uniref:Pre-mRNA-splicing factor n=1 Tax=Paraconiothyrium brasiliense TaxID=300254 RepID=A0ABR3QVT7_9PLEO